MAWAKGEGIQGVGGGAVRRGRVAAETFGGGMAGSPQSFASGVLALLMVLGTLLMKMETMLLGVFAAVGDLVDGGEQRELGQLALRNEERVDVAAGARALQLRNKKKQTQGKRVGRHDEQRDE